MNTNIPPANHVQLDRIGLVRVLEYLGYRIGQCFSHSVRLIVHGGACMLLHPGLYNLAQQQATLTPDMPIRRTTRDVDYLHRAFLNESLAHGEYDGPLKLMNCIRDTAVRFGLGADWMNSAADVALPMTTDPTGRHVDPIYTASIQKSNVDCHTIFSSANGMLKLVSVTPFWAISLKLVRYTKWDPYDICILLKYGTILSPGSGWTREYLERWLQSYCWSMGYANYTPEKKAELQHRMKDAIKMVNERFAKTPTLQEFSSTGFRTDPNRIQPEYRDSHSRSMIIHASRDLVMGTEGLDGNKAEWGGGDRAGWKASFAGDWVKPNEFPKKSLMPSPSVFPQYLQNTFPQHSPSLSPDLTPHNSPLSPPPQKKTFSNVADWAAEKQRDQQRELEGRKKRERVEEVVTPFIPSLPQGFEWSQTENALGLIHEQTLPAWPSLERSAYSQPLATSHPQIYSFHHTPPVPTPTLYPAPPRHGPSIYSHPQVYASPYSTPPPPIFYSSPPTKVKVKIERKKKGKARDKARGKARSAKKWRQTHSMSADGTFLVNLWREVLDSEDDDDDDEDENPTPDSTPKQLTPAIYPLTTVVYYNQYLEQQQQRQQPPQSAAFAYPNTSKPSPPPTGLPYTQSPTYGGQTWSSYPAMPVPHMSGHSYANLAPAPTLTYSQPVIPPEEYTRCDHSPSTLQKFMLALKI